MHDALAEVERALQCRMQLDVGVRADCKLRHRQFDRVLLEALQARPARGRDIGAVDAQVSNPFFAAHLARSV